MRRQSVARNAVLNLLGQGSPLLIAAFAIPVLTRGLGTARFGILTLGWVVLGYFSLFDLGIARALTKLVAEKLGQGQDEEIPALAWTSLLLMLALGITGMLVAFALSPWLVFRVLEVPDELHSEALRSFYLLAASIPVVITTAGFRGILEARERFDLVNAVRVPMGVFTYLGPALVLPFSRSLVPTVAVLLIGRIVAWGVHLALALRTLPQLRQPSSVRRELVTPLLRFGAWMTVSNIVGPLMVTFDRFVIGAIASVSAVAFYTAPFEAVTKLSIMPGALAGVLFPAFASRLGPAREDAALLYSRALKGTFIGIFPIALGITTFAREGLHLWLGADFAAQSTRVLQWLSAGVLFNSVALIPSTLVHGAGRPDLTAKLHVVELPFYFLSLWWLIPAYGIEGAAFAWAARCVVDTLALLGLVQYLLPLSAQHVRRMVPAAALSLGILAIAFRPMHTSGKLLFFLCALAVLLPVAWLSVLGADDRIFMRALLGRLAPHRQ